MKAKLESGSSHFSFKRLVPGSFNLGLIVSTCTAIPRCVMASIVPLVPCIDRPGPRLSGSLALLAPLPFPPLVLFAVSPFAL